MNFKLYKTIENNYWYHATDKDFNTFKSNWQGIHLANTKYGAIAVSKNRGSNAILMYTCEIDSSLLNPLHIDCDPMSWSAKDISLLLYNKLKDLPIEGAAGEDVAEEPDERGNIYYTNYKYDLSPDIIYIDNLTDEDEQFLLKYKDNKYMPLKDKDGNRYEDPQKEIDFFAIVEFLESKGFNCIMYPLAEDMTHNAIALIVFDPSIIRIINKNDI